METASQYAQIHANKHALIKTMYLLHRNDFRKSSSAYHASFATPRPSQSEMLPIRLARLFYPVTQ